MAAFCASHYVMGSASQAQQYPIHPVNQSQEYKQDPVWGIVSATTIEWFTESLLLLIMHTLDTGIVTNGSTFEGVML